MLGTIRNANDKFCSDEEQITENEISILSENLDQMESYADNPENRNSTQITDTLPSLTSKASDQYPDTNEWRKA